MRAPLTVDTLPTLVPVPPEFAAFVADGWRPLEGARDDVARAADPLDPANQSDLEQSAAFVTAAEASARASLEEQTALIDPLDAAAVLGVVPGVTGAIDEIGRFGPTDTPPPTAAPTTPTPVDQLPDEGNNAALDLFAGLQSGFDAAFAADVQQASNPPEGTGGPLPSVPTVGPVGEPITTGGPVTPVRTGTPNDWADFIAHLGSGPRVTLAE